MATPTKQTREQIASIAHRLRAVQSDFADEPADVRHQHIADELDQMLAEVRDRDRTVVLAGLVERFPAFAESDASSENGAPQPGNGVDTHLEELAERLAKAAASLDAGSRKRIAAILTDAGLAETATSESAAGGPLELGDHRATLAKLLQVKDAETLDSSQAAHVLTPLVEFAVKLDQIVGRTWRELAGRAAGRETTDLRRQLARALHRDADGRAHQQLAVQIEQSRMLVAFLISAIGLAPRQFAQQHAQRFAPSEIEAMARLDKSMLTSIETASWSKYKSMAAETDAAAIEADIRKRIVSCVESLMKSGRNERTDSPSPSTP